MAHLSDTTLEDLQRALEEVDGTRPAVRLSAAIAYKNGVTQTELARWYGVRRKTIYNWLTRLEERSLVAGAEDRQRTGRTRKITDEQRREFERALERPPGEAGYDEADWTPELVRRFLRERFDVEYSLSSCRRLMREASARL